jgi:HAD superfamily hydrolase (TIGR01509 family)
VRIRTITIDFWGTLLFDGPASDDRYKRWRLGDFEKILDGIGVRASPAVLDRAYERCGSFLASVWSECRDVPAEAHVRAILDAIDPQLGDRLSPETRAALLDAYARPALMVPPTVDDGARTALETLCSRGYTLAVVSNTMRTPGVTLRKLLERYRLLACFTHTTFSDEVGIRKPAPEIFHLTLRAVGGEPDHAVHVGDDLVLDVQGARAAGMRVIQVSSTAPKGLGFPGPDGVIPRLALLPDAIARLEGETGGETGRRR